MVTLHDGSILPTIFLNRIVRQVPESVVLIIFHAILHWWKSDVSLLENVSFQVVRNQNPNSYIEFSVHNQEGFFQILLDQKLVCFNHSWTSRLDSYILIAIKKLRFFSLFWLTICRISWQNTLLDTLWITLYVIYLAFWVLLLFVFDQRLFDIAFYILFNVFV